MRAADVFDLVPQLVAAGATVATAESLTGGQVAAALTTVPGASAVYTGGVVAYATDVKRGVLGVPSLVVAEHGVVSGACAEAMARGVRDLLATTYGVATTGVAGPDTQDGQPVGTVYVGIAGPVAVRHARFELAGDRAEIQAQAVRAALSVLADMLETDGPAS